MSVATLNINWVAPGPVSSDYLRCDARVCAIIGPIGSSKTSSSFQKLMRTALFTQQPHPADGWVRARFIAVRETYREIEKTMLPTWQRWFPPAIGEFTGGTGGRPARHAMKFDLQGRKIDVAMEFAGIGEQSAEDFARGLEPTSLYMDEADLMSKSVFTQLLGRLGRYPPVDEAAGFAGCTLSQLLLSMNAPNIEDWAYQDLIEQPIAGSKTFIQPSGLSSDAENIPNLEDGYYEKRCIGQPDWWVRRMIRNEFGFSRGGQPVFPEFSDHRHVAKSILQPIRELQTIIGCDAGLYPAAEFAQQMPNGQWRGYDEIVGLGIGAKRFGEEILRRLDGPDRMWRGLKHDPIIVVDPAAYARSSTDERSWAEVVKETTQLKVVPAPTNNLLPRLEAIRRPLTREVEADTPGMLISTKQPALRKALNGGYRFRKVLVANSERYEDKPEKNESSHPVDGWGYGLSYGGEYAEVTGRARKRRERIERERGAPQRDYDPFAW